MKNLVSVLLSIGVVATGCIQTVAAMDFYPKNNSAADIRFAYIADNTDSSFKVGGTGWAANTGRAGFYGTNYHSTGNTATSAKWSLNIEASGMYAIYYNLPAMTSNESSICNDVTYTVTAGTDVYTETNVSLRKNPGSSTGGWYKLGEYNISSGDVTVELKKVGTGAIMADAIGFIAMADQYDYEGELGEQSGATQITVRNINGTGKKNLVLAAYKGNAILETTLMEVDLAIGASNTYTTTFHSADIEYIKPFLWNSVQDANPTKNFFVIAE